MRVMVVEDHMGVANVLDAFLTSEGHQVTTVTSGFPGLLDSKWDRTWEQTDTVITDVRLGGETTGWELLRWLADRHPRVRRVLLTAVPVTVEETDGVCHAVLEKPAGVDEIRRAVTGDQ